MRPNLETHDCSPITEACRNWLLRCGAGIDRTRRVISAQRRVEVFRNRSQAKLDTRRDEMKKLNRILPVIAVLALLATVNSFAAKMDVHTSSMFQGPKANTGTVEHYVENGKS